jgi:hypothetical protein
VDTGYVQPMNFLAPRSRDMFNANNKVVDYLFCALCQPEFYRVKDRNGEPEREGVNGSR